MKRVFKQLVASETPPDKKSVWIDLNSNTIKVRLNSIWTTLSESIGKFLDIDLSGISDKGRKTINKLAQPIYGIKDEIVPSPSSSIFAGKTYIIHIPNTSSIEERMVNLREEREIADNIIPTWHIYLITEGPNPVWNRRILWNTLPQFEPNKVYEIDFQCINEICYGCWTSYDLGEVGVE